MTIRIALIATLGWIALTAPASASRPVPHRHHPPQYVGLYGHRCVFHAEYDISMVDGSMTLLSSWKTCPYGRQPKRSGLAPL